MPMAVDHPAISSLLLFFIIPSVCACYRAQLFFYFIFLREKKLTFFVFEKIIQKLFFLFNVEKRK